MAFNEFKVKIIPKTSFFEVYDELSYRDPRKEFDPIGFRSDGFFNHPAKEKFEGNNAWLNFKEPKANTDELFLSKPDQTRRKPPLELIAIEIPLKTEEISIESSSSSSANSAKYMNAYKDSRNFSDKTSELSYNSFDIPKIPKSIQSTKSLLNLQQTQRIKSYTKHIKQAESFSNIENIEENDKEEEPLVLSMKDTKVLQFQELLDFIFNECGKQNKKTEGCFIKCSKKDKIKENQKVDHIFYVLGQSPFELSKLLHRNLLRKYFFSIDEKNPVPKLSI